MFQQRLAMIGTRLVGYPIALGCIGIGYGVFRTTRMVLIQAVPGGEKEHSFTSFFGGATTGAAVGYLRYQLGKQKIQETETLKLQLYKNISSNSNDYSQSILKSFKLIQNSLTQQMKSLKVRYYGLTIVYSAFIAACTTEIIHFNVPLSEKPK